ncbi:MAG: AtpZ/AtpI family protein [bacterium]|nr:AtpZ/AtpI family protein [bacterium]
MQTQGIALFFNLSGWLAGPIIIALFLGKWLDGKYHTGQMLFFVCLGVAFLITCFGIVKETKAYIKKIEKPKGP